MSKSSDKSRRNLIKVGVLAAGATGLAGAARAQTQAPSQGKSSLDEKLDGFAVSSEPAVPDQSNFESTSQTTARQAAEEQSWATIATKIEKNFGLGSNLLSDPLQHYMRRIESDFTFAAEPNDADFNPLHVEPLLDQAADLLDRGIRERAAWDELGAKATSIALELTEYAALDAIHKDEEQDGLYEVAYRVAAAELDSEAYLASRYNWAASLADRTRDYHLQKGRDVLAGTQCAAWLGGLVPYTFGDGGFRGYFKNSWNGKSDTHANHLYNAAVAQSNYVNVNTQYSQSIQYATLKGSAQASSRRQRGLEKKADWERKNREFRKRRTVAARHVQDLKSKAATDPDGLLNYARRMPAIKERFEGDFRNAIARIKPAAEGLSSLYRYNVPLPDENNSEYFDNCLIWTREAIHWLIRFARQEQGVVLPISIRDLLGKDSFKEQVRNGSLEFSLGAAFFEGMSHVRLRGISACSRSDQDDDLLMDQKRLQMWKLSVTPPSTARIQYLDGQEVEVKQTVPPCRLYRVSRRNSMQEPDVFGASALHNASPIGSWKISILGSVPNNPDSDDLKDVELDLHLGFRATD